MGQYKQGHTLRLSPLQGIKLSDLVFDAGSLRAFVVLMTPGNSAQEDPVEERGAPLYRVFLGHTEVL